VTPEPAEFRFESDRVAALLNTVERMASGQLDVRLPISPRHDALDAIAHGINVLVGELSWAAARTREADERKGMELRAAVTSAEARTGALLKAIPDLMFVLHRDGTYLDYDARDPKLLFVPSSAFLGRKVREIMPPALAEVMMDALQRACQIDEPVVVEYELPMDEPRFYEARIVQVDADRLLSIVRDVTEAKRASELNRDLAGRLIASQEVERQRIARELHDDISQRLALLNFQIDRAAEQVDAEELRVRLRKLSAQAGEIGSDVHHMAYELHPSRLRTVGIVDALQSLCRDTSQLRNLQIGFSHQAVPPSVDGDILLCLYRIVQEALHNVARHSQAREAQVSLTCDEGHIALQVADSGVGFDPKSLAQASLGLVSMRERVAAVKGQFAIAAAPGGGTQITVRVPLRSQPAGVRVAVDSDLAPVPGPQPTNL
jgi:signal transduction histidine kinase